MKRPPSQKSRGTHEILALSSREGKPNGKLKNQQWLKRHGISSQAFGNAKSEGSYNPHLIKKQRELYRNAKLIKKFKKSVKQQSSDNSMLQVSVPEIDDPEIELVGDGQQKLKRHSTGQERGGLHGDVQQGQSQHADQERRKGKKKTTLQFVREEYEKRRAEEEKAKMEREAIAKARQEEKERVMAKRKELRGQMFKKTRSGQPVMKFRIQHMLEGISRNSDK